MDRRLQIVIDAHDPRALGGFWAQVLGYVEDPPPPGFSTWDEALRGWGLPEDRWNDAYAVVDPEGAGPRLYLQKVPEDKVTKNRLHLDVGQPGHVRGEEPTVRRSARAPTSSSRSGGVTSRSSTARSRASGSSCRTPRATSSASSDASIVPASDARTPGRRSSGSSPIVTTWRGVLPTTSSSSRSPSLPARCRRPRA